MGKQKIENIELKYLTVDDFEELKEATLASYAGVLNSYWKKHHIEDLTRMFPEGQVIIKIDGDIAGCALSLIVDYNSIDDEHTYEEL
ncbi:carbon-nitrogen hydrolase [Jejuia pallidilutea]|uniref:Carbon-nitrogen hydrolase n=1 Tax=Jejuia pallidilutea TaxID=504487 RepID=A0A090VQ07_9FLAO|nr:carbon-nitrogen hydrolase [Jejuia pallidilutea]